MKYFLSYALLSSLMVSGCSPEPIVKINNTAKATVDDYRATGIIAQPLPDIIAALEKGDISAEQLVEMYLARIDKIDKNGPTLQAVLNLNPDALAAAKLSDQQRAKGDIKGALHGVPILLKDNIESLDNMPTTAGALALIDNVTGRDSPLVAGLRAQGAIILGKTNLSQWANFRSEDSISGWSALGGQVRNPHMLDRNPCGSSSGSGAATAASFAAATVGTETNGSIICPANANGIVGFKPTVGIVPQQHIIPISASQDTAGPMTKTVRGAALMMNAMATTTPDIDYTAGLSKNALSGVRVGVLDFAKGSSAAILALFNQALVDLEKAGAILVKIEEGPSQPDKLGRMAYDILKYELNDRLNAYLASTSAQQVKPRSLQELIAFNDGHKDVEMALFDQSIFSASEQMDSLESAEYQTAIRVVQQASRQDGIDKLLQEHNVVVLVAPSGLTVPRIDPINGDVWPNNWPGYGSQAARAGYPHATVPMGGVHALSVGLSFISTKNADAQVLAYAYAYEQHSLRRLEPLYLNNAEEIPAVSKAMAPYKVGSVSH